MFLATSAYAQTSPLIIDRARLDRAAPPPTPGAPPVAAPGPQDDLSKIAPFILTGIRVEGTSLSPQALDDAGRPYIGRFIDARDIAAIAQGISQAYANSGDVALYMVTAPQQDFAGGLLRLIVTEGYIAHIDLTGDVSGDLSRVTALAQRLTEERPLKRSTLERVLSLMRDLPGLTVDAQLLRGDAPGAVKLLLGLKQQRYQVALSLNDAGNSILGRWQVQADVSLYNLFREGEETTASFGTSTEFNRFQFYALSHSEALDDNGTRAAASYGYLRTRVSKYGLSGDAQTAQLAVSHPFIRSYRENWTGTLSVDGIDSSNAVLGKLLANENIRALRLSSVYGLTDEHSALSLSGSLNFGLPVLGVHANPATADKSFQKLVLQGGYNRILGDWIVRLRAASQLAFGKLPVSELYALGGPQFGRAFLSATALGDSALAESAEIGFGPKPLPDILNGLEIFAFADNGDTWYRARAPTPALHHRLASAGGGVRLPLGTATKLELEGADALDADVPGIRAGSWRVLFALSASY
ncbi:MAG TPA: ShlB/FhaC/HecB family hemolysin secretion/activation protein [Rhizomicrobium sp.]|nr:ShlB/FhaC/HecB family hemolysin secretion/activation protein [Rhizomicrobium sp.]